MGAPLIRRQDARTEPHAAHSVAHPRDPDLHRTQTGGDRSHRGVAVSHYPMRPGAVPVLPVLLQKPVDSASRACFDFDKSIIKYPNIRRFPRGASDDLRPNLQNPANPVPAMDPTKPVRIKGGGA